jgi:hypothetical protein|nr:MAG TPA: hypothetical protein [Bacteriophage sp.]
MNYEINRAIGKVIGEITLWEKIPLSENVENLYKKYSSIRLEVTNKYSKEKGVVLLDEYFPSMDRTNTIEEWLASIGETGLKYTNLKVNLGRKGLIYREVLSNRFKVTPVSKGKLPDGDLSHKFNYDDLFITKEGVDPIDLQKHVLFTVNGFLHQTDANSKGLWITDGYKTIRRRKKHCIGAISFENLGEVKQIDIKEDMISKLNEKVGYYSECIIDIGEDVSNKTIMLVLGGYLHVLDFDVFTMISDSAIKVKFKNIPLLERVHASADDLDMADTFFHRTYGDRNVILRDIYSDDFIMDYLKHSTSFIVLLDNPEVFKEITYPQQRNIPNNYLSDTKPILPMMTRLGKFEEYVSIRDTDKYVLETADCQYHVRFYNSYRIENKNTYLNDAGIPTNRLRIPQAYFFNLLTFL